MRIVGCYGFKGGTGRSFLTASMAVVLAGAGHNVLVVDWDLEAPGIGDYFGQTDPQKPRDWRRSDGVLDMIRNFVELDGLSDPAMPSEGNPILENAIPITLRWFKDPKGGKIPTSGEDMLGKLYLLGPGLQLRESTALDLMNADWVGFHRFSGASFFQHFRRSAEKFFESTAGGISGEARRNLVFIDTRTGYNLPSVNAMGALADEILIFTTTNNQSIQSAAEMSRAISTWADHYREDKAPAHRRTGSPDTSVVMSRYNESDSHVLEEYVIRSVFTVGMNEPKLFKFPSLRVIKSREMTLMDEPSLVELLQRHDSIGGITGECDRRVSDSKEMTQYLESFFSLYEKLSGTNFFARESVDGLAKTRWQHVLRSNEEKERTLRENFLETSEDLPKGDKEVEKIKEIVEKYIKMVSEDIQNKNESTASSPPNPKPSGQTLALKRNLEDWSKASDQSLISAIRETIINECKKDPSNTELRKKIVSDLKTSYNFETSPRGNEFLVGTEGATSVKSEIELPEKAKTPGERERHPDAQVVPVDSLREDARLIDHAIEKGADNPEGSSDEASAYRDSLEQLLTTSTKSIDGDDPAAAVTAALEALDFLSKSGDPESRSRAILHYVKAVSRIAGLPAKADLDTALDKIENAISNPSSYGPYRRSSQSETTDGLDVVSYGGMLLSNLLEDFPALSSAALSALAEKAKPVHTSWLEILKACPEDRLEPLDRLVMLARAADLRCGIAHALDDTGGRIEAARAAYKCWEAVRAKATQHKPPSPNHLESALTAAVAAAGHLPTKQMSQSKGSSTPASLEDAIKTAKTALAANLRPGTYPLRDAVEPARQLALLLLDCSRPLEALACALDANQILARSSGFAASARPNNGSPEALWRAALLMRLGTCYQRLGRPDIAGATWDSAIKLTAGAPVGSFRNYVGNALGWCKEALHYDKCEFQKATDGLTDRIQKAGAEVLEPGDGIITYVDRVLFRSALIQSMLYVGNYLEAQDQSDRMIAELQRRARWDAGSTALLAMAWQGLAEAKLSLGDIPSAKHAAEQSLHEYRCYVELTNRTPVPRAAAALLDLRAALRLGKPPSKDDVEKVAKSARTALGDLVGLASSNPNWWNTPELAAWGDIPRLELAETICLASLMMRAIGKPERAETLVNEVEEEWLKKSGWSAQSSQAKVESDSRSPEPPYWQARLDHVRRLAALCRSPEAPPVGSWFHRYTDLLSPKPASIGEGR